MRLGDEGANGAMPPPQKVWARIAPNRHRNWKKWEFSVYLSAERQALDFYAQAWVNLQITVAWQDQLEHR